MKVNTVRAFEELEKIKEEIEIATENIELKDCFETARRIAIRYLKRTPVCPHNLNISNKECASYSDCDECWYDALKIPEKRLKKAIQYIESREKCAIS